MALAAYGIESKVIKLPNGVKRRIQIRSSSGRAAWVTQRNGKLVNIAGKVSRGTFVPKKDSDLKWIMEQFKPQRDRTNPPMTPDELYTKTKKTYKTLQKETTKKLGNTVRFGDEIKTIQYTRKTVFGYGKISIHSKYIYGMNVNGEFVPAAQ